MHSKPQLFNVIAGVFITISLSFPLQIAILYNHGFTDFNMILNKISISNLMVMACLLLNVPLLVTVSPNLKWTLPATIFVVTWNNLIVGSYGHDYSPTVTTLSSLAFTAMFLPLVQKEYRVLLKHPELRWWLRPTRIQAPLYTLLQPHVGKKVVTELFDISETGAFIPIENVDEAYMKVGDLTTLNIRLSQFKSFKCEAQIVRMSKAHGKYPEGMGIRFLEVSPKMRAELRDFINELH